MMNPNTELEFCTALVSQLGQVLSEYNCVDVGLKLLESEQMDLTRIRQELIQRKLN